MKRIVILLLALLSSASMAWTQAVPESLSVMGVVINGVDANPLPLCVVKFMQKGECRASAISDYAGEYRLPRVAPGLYDILVTQFGDTLMHYKGLKLEKDMVVRTVVLPPADNGNDRLPQDVDGKIKNLRPVLIYSHRHQLAKMGLLITSPDDPRLWNFSGRMDDLFDLDLSFWYSKYKTFYKLKAMGYNITSPFELVYPEIYHPASDSVVMDYKVWILGIKF